MSIINVHDRLSAVLSSAVSIAGMYGVLYYASYRLASSLRSESLKTANSTPTAAASSKQSNEPVPAVPTIMLTPWIKVPLKVPVVLSGSFIISVAAKAFSFPQVYPVSDFLKIDEKLSYAAGIALFAASAYLHYIRYVYIKKCEFVMFRLLSLCSAV
jgi:hypothetical protein